MLNLERLKAINVQRVVYSFSPTEDPKSQNKLFSINTSIVNKTLRQLSDAYHRSIPWVRKQIFEYEPNHPREVLIVADATFFGKRKDKFGVLVLKDVWSGDILIWKYIESETIKDYTHLKNELEDKGFSVKGIVIDGKRGLFKAFDKFSVKGVTFIKR